MEFVQGDFVVLDVLEDLRAEDDVSEIGFQWEVGYITMFCVVAFFLEMLECLGGTIEEQCLFWFWSNGTYTTTYVDEDEVGIMFCIFAKRFLNRSFSVPVVKGLIFKGDIIFIEIE